MPRISKKTLELLEDAYWTKAANSRERALVRKKLSSDTKKDDVASGRARKIYEKRLLRRKIVK